MRLTADRFDTAKWPNLRPDQDGDTRGTHVISSKPKGGLDGSAQSAAVAATSAVAALFDFATSTLSFATSTFFRLLAWLR